MLETMLITNNPEIADYASQSGVSRIFIDLETLGKEERQKNQNMRLTNHRFSDISKVKIKATQSKVLVRINPPNPKTKDEVEAALDHGADIIMLPYFTHPDEVEFFLKAVNGRSRTSLLVETSTSMARIARILDLLPSEIHIGLNDLKLTFGLINIFEMVCSGLLEGISATCLQKNISFGIGGIGSITKGADIAPEIILKEYARLSSERVILSRSFTNYINPVQHNDSPFNLRYELELLQNKYKNSTARSADEVRKDQLQFTELIQQITQLPHSIEK